MQLNPNVFMVSYIYIYIYILCIYMYILCVYMCIYVCIVCIYVYIVCVCADEGRSLWRSGLTGLPSQT